MKGKKLMAMLMAGSLLLAGLTGCGGSTAKGGGAAASADDYPNGPVTIICPWGVGGGAVLDRGAKPCLLYTSPSPRD